LLNKFDLIFYASQVLTFIDTESCFIIRFSQYCSSFRSNNIYRLRLRISADYDS